MKLEAVRVEGREGWKLEALRVGSCEVGGCEVGGWRL